jgi:type 1 glutamine amidotransferase
LLSLRDWSERLFLVGALLPISAAASRQPQPSARVLVLYENGGHHIDYSKRARTWLDRLAAKRGLAIDYIMDTDTIDEASLSRYQLFIQLDYPPYAWKPKAVTAFEKFMTEGRGGWIGFHHASLLGEFDGYPMWDWYSKFMGDIRFKDYIATFAQARVNVEDRKHPAMRGIPAAFVIEKDEWYTYNRSPRPNVHVIASVDESSYKPDSKIKMGDHPVIWTNPAFPTKNIYIFMGHSPDLFDNKAYTRLFENSIVWAAGLSK